MSRRLRPANSSDTAPSDYEIRLESTRSVMDFNKETARYCNLVVGLGASQDNDNLRDELKRIRRRAVDHAQQTKIKLLPLLRKQPIKSEVKSEDQANLEHLFRLFISCLEFLESQLAKTLFLQRMFPLNSDSTVLINTGIAEPLQRRRCSLLADPDPPSTSKVALSEGEEFKRLESEITELQAMLYSINQSVDIQPWEIESEVNNAIKYDYSKVFNLDTSSQAPSDIVTVHDPSRMKKRRCICIIVLSICFVVAVGTIIGVVVALVPGKFSGK